MAQQEAAAAVAQAAVAEAAAEAARKQQATLAAGPPVPAGLPASAPATPDGKRGKLFPTAVNSMAALCRTADYLHPPWHLLAPRTTIYWPGLQQ